LKINYSASNAIEILISPYLYSNNNMNMNLVDSVLNTPRTNDKMDTGAANGGGDAMDSEEMQVRTMEVPRWLSTPDVTSKSIVL